jgi:hypothetical protein
LKPEIYVKMVQLTEGWFCVLRNYFCDSVVDIATGCGMDDPGELEFKSW